MHGYKLSLVAVVLALVALGIVIFSPSSSREDHASKQETTFERVLRTGVIRCGYPVWPPSNIVDPNTKILSGYSHDLTEAVADELSLKRLNGWRKLDGEQPSRV